MGYKQALVIVLQTVEKCLDLFGLRRGSHDVARGSGGGGGAKDLARPSGSAENDALRWLAVMIDATSRMRAHAESSARDGGRERDARGHDASATLAGRDG